MSVCLVCEEVYAICLCTIEVVQFKVINVALYWVEGFARW